MVKKAAVFVISVVLLVGINFCIISQAYSVPEYIRVALKYESTAVTIVTTSSDTGGNVGIVLNSNYTLVESFVRNDSISVVFDSLYHLQIGEEFESIGDAKQFILELKEHGGPEFNIPLFPVFTGKWIVCASNYSKKPEMDVTVSDKGIDEYKILFETFTLPVFIDTPEGKEVGPSYTVTPLQTSQFSMKLNINGYTVFTVSDVNNSATIRIMPTVPADTDAVPLLKLDKARYRGMFDIHRQTGTANGVTHSNFVLVNRLRLEEYLYSVVPAEMSAGSDSQFSQRVEALKVQAITARTFAVRFIEGQGYGKYRADLEDTVTTQVYGGYTRTNGAVGEYANTTKAVDMTKGKVLIYDGKLAQYVYYHSHSGGYTEHPRNVWGGTSSLAPYVVSKPDPYTNITPRKWTGMFTGISLQQTFRQYILDNHNVDVGKIKYVNVVSRSASGRITGTLIEGSQSSFTVQWEKNRWMLNLETSSLLYTYEVNDKLTIVTQRDGQDKFLSERARKIFEGNYFTKEFLGDSYALIGKDGYTYERLRIFDSPDQLIKVNGNGTGHGVGMSQLGVQEMSKLGKTAEEIIQFYFPGLKIE